MRYNYLVENNKKLQKIDSLRLCEYIMMRGGSMSNIKLQKLLYYVHVYHLAWFDVPLIDDDFHAWMNGPVSMKVYEELKQDAVLYDIVECSPPKDDIFPLDYIYESLTEEQIQVINAVIEEYGQRTAAELRYLTCHEEPWKSARKGYCEGDICEEIIDRELMRVYYKKYLADGKK
jgi:uncharacterized phage-associated protein